MSFNLRLAYDVYVCVCSGNVLIDLTGNDAKWFVVMIFVVVGKQNNNQNETAKFFNEL